MNGIRGVRMMLFSLARTGNDWEGPTLGGEDTEVSKQRQLLVCGLAVQSLLFESLGRRQNVSGRGLEW